MNLTTVGDLPAMTKTSYASSTAAQGLIMGNAALSTSMSDTDSGWMSMKPEINRAFTAAQQQSSRRIQQPKEQSMNRIVKVFIADIDNNIPVNDRVIYRGDEKFTDLTDQELYFELPMAELLAQHNEYRSTLMDKKASEKFGRDVKLEPIKVRDLKMCVVDIASF